MMSNRNSGTGLKSILLHEKVHRNMSRFCSPLRSSSSRPFILSFICNFRKALSTPPCTNMFTSDPEST